MPEPRVSATPSGAAMSTPSRRKGSVTPEPKQPKKRVRLSPEVLDQEAASPTPVEGIGESPSTVSENETDGNHSAAGATGTQHIPEYTPQSDLTPAKSPFLLASGLTPDASTPARYSSQDRGATTGDTTAASATARLTPLREKEGRIKAWLWREGHKSSSASSTTFSSCRPKPDGRTQASEEGDRHQMGLVQLIAMADKFGWISLFNDAVDAYMDGERVLGRRWIWLAHLEVAYTKCGPSSLLRRLLCDRVLFEATNGSTFWRYAGALSRYEDFLADLLERLDRVANLSVAGVNAFMELDNPLYRMGGEYHARG